MAGNAKKISVIKQKPTMLYLQRFYLMQLIHFLGGQAELSDGDFLTSGEQEIVYLVIADADAVGNFVPIVIGI